MNETYQNNIKIFSTILTLLVFCFFVFIFFGEDAIEMLFMIIVCTAGLGLIPLIILLVIFWGIVYNLVKLLFRVGPELTISQKKIITYINSCEKAKISKNDIINKLVGVGGWKMKDVEEAYDVRDKFKYYDNKKII